MSLQFLPHLKKSRVLANAIEPLLDRGSQRVEHCDHRGWKIQIVAREAGLLQARTTFSATLQWTTFQRPTVLTGFFTSQAALTAAKSWIDLREYIPPAEAS